MSLDTFHTALAAAQTGTSSARVLVVGDSLEEGEGASTRATRWIDTMLTNMRSTYGLNSGGLGLTPASQYATYLGVSEPWRTPATPIGTTGTVTAFVTQGDKGIYLDSSGGAGISYTVTGDSIDVVYFGATSGQFGITWGSFTVAVDGTVVTTVNTQVSTYSPSSIAHVSLGVRGSHTVVIMATGGVAVVDGITVYNGDYSGGISYWDCSHTGYTSQDFAQGTPNQDYRLGWNNYQPHLILDGLWGGNDLQKGTGTPTDAANNLTDRINSYKALSGNPSIILMIGVYGHNSLGTYDGYTDIDYLNATIAAANAAGVAVYDSRVNIPTPPTSWFTEDPEGQHPDDTGQAALATDLAAFLAPVVVPPSGPIIRDASGNQLVAKDKDGHTLTVTW